MTGSAARDERLHERALRRVGHRVHGPDDRDRPARRGRAEPRDRIGVGVEGALEVGDGRRRALSPEGIPQRVCQAQRGV